MKTPLLVSKMISAIQDSAVSSQQRILKIAKDLVRLASWEFPNYTRFGLYSQAAIIVSCAFCFQWWPLIPTVAIGFLGVVAAIMTVRADQFSRGERAVYVFIAFGLFFVEMRAVYADRDSHDKEQRETRARESEARTKENLAFASLLQQGAGLFDSIKHVDALAEENLENETGGRSFAVVTPQVWAGLVPIPLSVRNNGKYTLTGVTIRIYGKQEFDLDNPRGFYEAPTINVGTLHAGELRLLKETVTPILNGMNDGKSEIAQYQIFISAQNFTVDEYLDFKQGQKLPWIFRYQVTRQFVKAQKGKTTYFGYEKMAATDGWLGEK